jgi:hypothetical protein
LTRKNWRDRFATIPLRSAILAVFCIVTNLIASAQAIPLGNIADPTDSSNPPEQSQDIHSSSLFHPAKQQMLEGPYLPMAPSESLRWFITNTAGPPHITGVAFVSSYSTAFNRPEEYGHNWRGFADRFQIDMAGSAASNAVEASAGAFLREDPRYFRASQQPFKARLGNVVRLTFLARGSNGSFGPAYARYMGIVGSNFISNAWRVHSEADTQDALIRSSEGFAGRMAANAFAEFWPDIQKHVFHKRD